MYLFQRFKDYSTFIDKHVLPGKKTGLVPTMGALHRGHFSLLAAAAEQADVTVLSIFVNPLQFNNTEDFKKYPATLQDDILNLEKRNCDVLLTPSFAEMYPGGQQVSVDFDLGDLDNIWEGQHRPGHFRGVCLAVDALLSAIKPDFIFLGQKDYQQCLVIKKMMADKRHQAEVIVCPTVREPSGLALSSRNMRLTPEGCDTASQLFKELSFLKDNLAKIPFSQLHDASLARLKNHEFDVEYLALADADSLQPAEKLETGKKYMLLVAAWLEGVRLIDNLIIG